MTIYTYFVIVDAAHDACLNKSTFSANKVERYCRFISWVMFNFAKSTKNKSCFDGETKVYKKFDSFVQFAGKDPQNIV